jgi:hypothetical protein
METQEVHQNDIFSQKFNPMTTIEVVKGMDELRKTKDQLEAELKAVNAEYDFLRHIYIPERFENEGIDNLKVTDVGRVSLTSDIRVAVNAADKDQVFEYFDAMGKGDIVTKTINASTLKAVVKTMILQGEEVPENIIKVTPFTRASITKR